MATTKDIAELFDYPLEAEDWLDQMMEPNGTILWGKSGTAITTGELYDYLVSNRGKYPYETAKLATLVHRRQHPEIVEADSYYNRGESTSPNFGKSSRCLSLDRIERERSYDQDEDKPKTFFGVK